MTIIKNNKILIFLGLYFLIKIFSYFFSPNTPLYSANPINTLVSILILGITSYFLIKKNQLGWIIIAGEIILGGGGGYFQILGISLRTLLLIFSITIYFFQNFQFSIFNFQTISNFSIFKKLTTPYLLLTSLLLWGVISAINGLYNGHAILNVYSDFIPYLYLLYFFPLRELLKNQQFKNTAWKMLIASIIGNTVFILFIFFTFSSEIFILQENFYYWYRQIALGKITDTGTGFFRVVLDEHLLLIPIALLVIGKILRFAQNDIKNNNHYYLLNTLYFLALIILSINITRIYLLALFVGYLFLFSKKYWKRWIKYGVLTGVIFLISFSSLNLIASKGSTMGFELLLSRLNSIVSPTTELSSLSRMLLLPEIIEKIKEHPILGSGLGDAVTVYSPVLDSEITTPHFDWGYLEIFAEMGLVGLIIWLSLIIYIFKNSKNKTLHSLLLALLIINITSPALFHSLGIILFIFILSKQYDRDSSK